MKLVRKSEIINYVLREVNIIYLLMFIKLLKQLPYQEIINELTANYGQNLALQN